jgi:hypothetical protein
MFYWRFRVACQEFPTGSRHQVQYMTALGRNVRDTLAEGPRSFPCVGTALNDTDRLAQGDFEADIEGLFVFALQRLPPSLEDQA